MVPSQHALFVPCRRAALMPLLETLRAPDDTGGTHLLHAAIIVHSAFGELDVTVAGDGPLGAMVGHRAFPATLFGPLSMVGVAVAGSATDDPRFARGPLSATLRALSDALPPGHGGLLLVVGHGHVAAVRRKLRSNPARPFIQFDVSRELEPWLAARIEVDMRVEPATLPAIAATG